LTLFAQAVIVNYVLVIKIRQRNHKPPEYWQLTIHSESLLIDGLPEETRKYAQATSLSEHNDLPSHQTGMQADQPGLPCKSKPTPKQVRLRGRRRKPVVQAENFTLCTSKSRAATSLIV
jgi:hypothetical protein